MTAGAVNPPIEHEPTACRRRPIAMTADARIRHIALIATVLGWPAVGLMYLLAGVGPVVEWSLVALIGLTIGLVMRWLTDWLA